MIRPTRSQSAFAAVCVVFVDRDEKSVANVIRQQSNGTATKFPLIGGFINIF